MVEVSSFSDGSQISGDTSDMGIQDWTLSFPIVSDYFKSLNMQNIIICHQNKQF